MLARNRRRTPTQRSTFGDGKEEEVEESLWVTPEKILPSGDSITSTHGSHMETSRTAKNAANLTTTSRKMLFLLDLRTQVLKQAAVEPKNTQWVGASFLHHCPDVLMLISS